MPQKKATPLERGMAFLAYIQKVKSKKTPDLLIQFFQLLYKPLFSVCQEHS